MIETFDEFGEFAASALRDLRRTAYLMCGDWYLAEDLAQEALIRVYRSWHRIQRRESLPGYARQTVVRLVIDERRRPHRRERLAAEAHDDPGRGRDRRGRRAYSECWRRWPDCPRGATCVVLRFRLDLSVAETARVLGCSDGTVKCQTSAALHHLQGDARRPHPGEERTMTDLKDLSDHSSEDDGRPLRTDLGDLVDQAQGERRDPGGSADRRTPGRRTSPRPWSWRWRRSSPDGVTAPGPARTTSPPSSTASRHSETPTLTAAQVVARCRPQLAAYSSLPMYTQHPDRVDWSLKPGRYLVGDLVLVDPNDGYNPEFCRVPTTGHEHDQ